MNKNTAQANYFKKQLVWACTAHYPCWPGIIQQVRKHKQVIIYRVKLLSTEKSYCAYMTETRMTPYPQFRQKFLKVQNNEHQLFRKAFENAEAIFQKGQQRGIVKKKNLRRKTKQLKAQDKILQTHEQFISEKSKIQIFKDCQRKQPFLDSIEQSSEENQQISYNISQQKQDLESVKSKRIKKGQQISNKQVIKSKDIVSKQQNKGSFSKNICKTSQNESAQDFIEKSQKSFQDYFNQQWKQKRQKISWNQRQQALIKLAKYLREKNLKVSQKSKIISILIKNMQRSKLDNKQFLNQTVKWIEKTNKEVLLDSYKLWQTQFQLDSQEQFCKDQQLSNDI